MTAYHQLSDDELLDHGAYLEQRFDEITGEFEALEPFVEAEGRKLRTVLIKLLVGVSATIATLLATPFAFGWALLAASLPAVLVVWEVFELRADYEKLRPLQRELAALRAISTGVASQLADVERELNARTG